MGNFINTALGLVLFVLLPCFIIYKIGKIIIDYINFNKEQKEKRNTKEIQYLEIKMLKLQQEIEYCKKYMLDDKGNVENGYGNKKYNKRYNKDVKEPVRTSPR